MPLSRPRLLALTLTSLLAACAHAKATGSATYLAEIVGGRVGLPAQTDSWLHSQSSTQYARFCSTGDLLRLVQVSSRLPAPDTSSLPAPVQEPDALDAPTVVWFRASECGSGWCNDWTRPWTRASASAFHKDNPQLTGWLVEQDAEPPGSYLLVRPYRGNETADYVIAKPSASVGKSLRATYRFQAEPAATRLGEAAGRATALEPGRPYLVRADHEMFFVERLVLQQYSPAGCADLQSRHSH